MNTPWTVRLAGRARKSARRLDEDIGETFQYLLAELAAAGPCRTNWPNYGRIQGAKDCHHCHLQKGNPTYVAVWRVDKTNRIVEITYVGTHEGAEYRRLC